MIILIDTKKISISFHDNSTQQTKFRKNVPQHNVIYDKAPANITFNNKNLIFILFIYLCVFCYGQEQYKDVHSCYFYFNILLEVLARAIWQEKEMKCIQIEKKEEKFSLAPDIISI